MSEERDDLIVLVDEDGTEAQYEHLDTVEMNGSEYVVLLPYDGEEENEEDEEEVIILKIEHNENGEDSFISIDDEEELDEVFEEFQSRLDDDYDPDMQ